MNVSIATVAKDVGTTVTGIQGAITAYTLVIAPWIPLTVVPTSFATVAIETFITDESSVIRNCAAASVSRTALEPCAAEADVPASFGDPVEGRLPPPAALMRGSVCSC